MSPDECTRVLLDRAQLHALIEYVNCYQSASTWTLSDGLQCADMVVNNLYDLWIHGKTGDDDIEEYIRQTQDIINEPDWREFIEVISRSAREYMLSECGDQLD